MNFQNGSVKNLKQIKKTVINVLNEFLHVVQRTATGLGSKVDFLKRNLSSRVSGFYTELGTIWMIEVSDIE